MARETFQNHLWWALKDLGLVRRHKKDIKSVCVCVCEELILVQSSTPTFFFLN